MISNDIKLVAISWNFHVRNRFSNHCVGVYVGGYPGQSFKVNKNMRNPAPFSEFSLEMVLHEKHIISLIQMHL